MSDALAWRSVFEIVNSIETLAGARRRGQDAVINGDLRSAALGGCRGKMPDEMGAYRWAEAPLFTGALW